jgi:hypothetical protein
LYAGHFKAYDGVVARVAGRGGPAFDIDLQYLGIPGVEERVRLK